jgi:hypothetical protein
LQQNVKVLTGARKELWEKLRFNSCKVTVFFSQCTRAVLGLYRPYLGLAIVKVETTPDV